MVRKQVLSMNGPVNGPGSSVLYLVIMPLNACIDGSSTVCAYVSSYKSVSGYCMSSDSICNGNTKYNVHKTYVDTDFPGDQDCTLCALQIFI